MILITTYYRLEDKKRNEEIDKCLFYNYQNDYIEKIYLLNNEIYNIPFIKDKKKKNYTIFNIRR